ncbi:MAG: hypothetical protein ACLP9S_06910 [Syntrophales bacterium]
MPKEKGLSKKEVTCSNILYDFAHAETERAIEVLSKSIRKLDELPASTQVREDESILVAHDQQNVKKIFKELYKGKALSDISPIDHFNFCYYAFFHSMADVQENHLYADPPHLFDDEPLPHTAILALCLVELLKADTEKIRKHIYKCKSCGSFFISIKKAKNIKYCPGYCRTKNKMTKKRRSKYDKKLRKMHKEMKAISERNNRINQIMEERKCSRKEAEQHYKDEIAEDSSTE